MKTALIGYTGFVGSNIFSQTTFDDIYNSKNIKSIHGRKYDLIVNAGVSGTKWIANANPIADLNQIKNLIDHLGCVTTKRIVHLSTFDVYQETVDVDEASTLKPRKNFAYGTNRFIIEEFIRSTFPKHTIIRLPGLYGLNLKKNFIYDFIHNRKKHLTDSRNVVQMYNLNHIWKDINIAIKNDLSLINFSVEPIPLKEIIKKIFKLDFENITKQKPTYYDVHTQFGYVYGSDSHYLYSKEQILKELHVFVDNELRTLKNVKLH